MDHAFILCDEQYPTFFVWDESSVDSVRAEFSYDDWMDFWLTQNLYEVMQQRLKSLCLKGENR